MNILLLQAHSISEYDHMRIFADLGYDVFSVGAYVDPSHPSDDKRPALQSVPYHADLASLVSGDQMAHKAHLPDGVIDWADVIVGEHYPEQWLLGQWARIRHKRVIWRTCGQSDPRLEAAMSSVRGQGLQIVRYSPRESDYFGRVGVFAGEDALIRFGKYTSDYLEWTGTDPVVGNVTQDMLGRGDHVGLGFWRAATRDLPTKPAGPGSEKLPGGVGTLAYDAMLEYLRDCRAYLYTGTVPASYTLGLIEAMLTGTPVVSIGPRAWMGPSDLFEGHEIAGRADNRPEAAAALLRDLLHDENLALVVGQRQQARARALFDVAGVGRQWQAFLGAGAESGAHRAHLRQAVSA